MVLFILNTGSYAYVHIKGSLGNSVRWPGTSMLVMVNSYLSGNDHQILSDSIGVWNGHSSLRMEVSSAGGPTTSLCGNGFNDIYYSSDATYFSGGCGVLAITTVIYNSGGDISEADVLLNGTSNCFSSNPTDDNYLGNVITHELGHVAGLGHSEVFASSMYYKAHVGQRTTSSDDQAGLFSLYPNGIKGTIAGKIIGGDNLTGVFGAHVQAVSMFSGKVEGAAISNSDGRFIIEGLPLINENKFYLYVSPLKVKSALPDYYFSSRSNFCSSRTAYRGSFFQGCYSDEEGYPTGIKISESSPHIEVGNITIRCNMDIAQDYLENKPSTSNAVMLDDLNGYIGDAFVGFFTKKYVYDGDLISYIILDGEDNFSIDLTTVNFSTMVAGDEDIYLEYRLVSQSIFSKLLVDIEINGMVQSFNFYDSDNIPQLEYSGRILLSKTSPGQNSFDFTISPKNRWGKCSDTLILPNDVMCPVNELYEDSLYKMDEGFYDNLFFYFLIFNVSKKKSTDPDISEKYTIISSKNHTPLKDNTLCPDASETYSVMAHVPGKALNSSAIRRNDDDVLSCATLGGDDENGPGQFLFVFTFGLLLTIVFGSRMQSALIPMTFEISRGQPSAD